jgi:hypothetical protein
MEMLGNDDGRPEQRVGVRVRRDDVTVRVKGEDLPLTLGVEHAARLVGIGRSSMYASVKRGDFETIQDNGRIAVFDATAAAADGPARARRRIAWTRVNAMPSMRIGMPAGRHDGQPDLVHWMQSPRRPARRSSRPAPRGPPRLDHAAYDVCALPSGPPRRRACRGRWGHPNLVAVTGVLRSERCAPPDPPNVELPGPG